MDDVRAETNIAALHSVYHWLISGIIYVVAILIGYVALVAMTWTTKPLPYHLIMQYEPDVLSLLFQDKEGFQLPASSQGLKLIKNANRVSSKLFSTWMFKLYIGWMADARTRVQKMSFSCIMILDQLTRRLSHSWWRHQMETFSATRAGNSPVPVNSPHKGQWRGALMFSLIYAWINDWVNNREAGDLGRQRGHCDVIVMLMLYAVDFFLCTFLAYSVLAVKYEPASNKEIAGLSTSRSLSGIVVMQYILHNMMHVSHDIF